MRVIIGAAATAAALLVGASVSFAQPPAARPAVATSSQIHDDEALPQSVLTVHAGGGWREWWNARKAPAQWTAEHAVLARLVEWERVADGVEHAELTIGGDEAFRTRLILVRLDPTRLRIELDTALTPRMRPAWTIADTPDDAIFAVNAGQFVRALPWGWVVLDGGQFLAPGAGPLSTAIMIDSAGRVRWRHGNLDRSAWRPRWAFQSYPTLLAAGEVPLPLQRSGEGVDVGHRDARLAIGRLDDRQLVIAMTRFDALGPLLGAVPLGLTTPEMAAVMGALGVRDAVMLDGGISAQMMLRDDQGRVRSWRGLRAVPLALIARPMRR